MQLSARPTVMSIAGFDPSGGAGVLADAKAFEQHCVHGIAVCTAQTLQTEHRFVSIQWEPEERILESTAFLLNAYPVRSVKIGIVQNMAMLSGIIKAIRAFDLNVNIILDPVIRATTSFQFWQSEIDRGLLFETLTQINLITPNQQEVLQLLPAANAKESAKMLRRYCPVLLKGGHSETETGVDYLFAGEQVEKLQPSITIVYPKHGSGCVLSAAIAANLALGLPLSESCRKAKSFTEKFLLSTTSLLGHHVS